ncbi:MAG: hypothetical protein AABZ74_14265 [Cyanobacteriota bacterium]
MSKKSLILSFIINSVFIFSCSIDKNTTNKVIQENKPIINNDTVIKTDESKNTYPDFKDSNLELPDVLILEKSEELQIIDKKGNIKNKINIDKSNHTIIKKGKSTIFLIDNGKGIRIVNYETDKEIYIPFSEKITYYQQSKNKIVFNSEQDDSLNVVDINGNIIKIPQISHNDVYLLYDNDNSIIFQKYENNKKQLYTSDLKGNIKYITEISGEDQKLFSLSQDNKKVTFLYQDSLYSINIDGTNKIKLIDKAEYSDKFEHVEFGESKFSPDNKYLLYSQLRTHLSYLTEISSVAEIHLIRSEQDITKSDKNAINFVIYGSGEYEWINNDSFVFKKIKESTPKNVKVKIEDLGNKINFIETDYIKIDNEINYKNIKIPEDYQIEDVEKSSDNKKIAYTVFNSKYYYSCPYVSQSFKINYSQNYCPTFEKDRNEAKIFLNISDPDGKNEVNLFEFDLSSFKYLDTFIWSNDNKFLFIEYNYKLYVYSLEKNKMYQIFDENSTLMNRLVRRKFFENNVFVE